MAPQLTTALLTWIAASVQDRLVEVSCIRHVKQEHISDFIADALAKDHDGIAILDPERANIIVVVEVGVSDDSGHT